MARHVVAQVHSRAITGKSTKTSLGPHTYGAVSLGIRGLVTNTHHRSELVPNDMPGTVGTFSHIK